MNEEEDKLVEVVETKLADDGTTTLHGTKIDSIKKKENGQNTDYVILSDVERARGFVRPVRRWYKHLKCGSTTSMPQKIAETYAAKPSFYGATFCCECGDHFPVGADGEFVWLDEQTRAVTNEKVGT